MPFLQTLGGGSALGFKSASGALGNYTEATGGISASYHDGTNSWKVHIFKDGNNQTFNVTKAGDDDLEYVVVAGGGGGGGGGNATWHSGGGGGAGGLITGTTAPIVQGYTIDVGSGGNGGNQDQSNPTRGSQGSNSVAFSQTATGGGGGGGGTGANVIGSNGGSGGGSGVTGTVSTGTSGQGNNGGSWSSYGGSGGDPYGAGGGGKGSTGTSNFGPNGPNNPAGYSRAGGGNGGSAWDISFMGVSTRLAEGGAAGGANDDSGGWAKGGCAGGRGTNQPGGWGGGRWLGTTANYAGENTDDHLNGKHGLDGTGMGGGGGWGGTPRGNGARGGNGCVIVKYPVQPYTGIGSSSGNPATSGKAIKDADSTVMSGFYWIKASGYGGAADWVYCDMDYDGGGWMHVATFQDDSQQGTTYPRECHPWGYYLHRANNNGYTESSSHGGRFTDNDYDEFLQTVYPAAFTSNFKHPHLYQSAPFTQVLMRDQGMNLRNVFTTNSFTQVNNTRDFFGNGTNMWVDSGTQRNSGGGGFRRLGVTSHGANDDVFQNATTIYFGFGEPSGVESGNQDRSMITPQGLNSQSVSATQGIGVSRANGSGYQRYRNIDNQFRDEPGGISSNYMYTMWIR